MRGERRLGSVQRLLPLDAIDGDTVWLRGGACRAVLECGAVHFAFKSEAEQEAIMAGFRRLLNGLTHPLQVLVRVLPADIDAYLAAVRWAVDDESLRGLARDHALFVQRLARDRTLLERRTYLVVPGDATALSRVPRRWSLRRPHSAAAHGREASHRTLAARCADLVADLREFGVAARRLDGSALAALWAATCFGRGTTAGHATVGPVVTGARVRAEQARA